MASGHFGATALSKSMVPYCQLDYKKNTLLKIFKGTGVCFHPTMKMVILPQFWVKQ